MRFLAFENVALASALVLRAVLAGLRRTHTASTLRPDLAGLESTSVYTNGTIRP